MDEKKLKKDIRTLIKVIDSNQRLIENLMGRVDNLEKKDEEKKKPENQFTYIQ